ncbi:MAG: hypothetical protein WCT04_05180 [Planctomycetota bacterium]
MNSAERSRQPAKRRNDAPASDADEAVLQASTAPVESRPQQAAPAHGYRTPVTRAEHSHHSPGHGSPVQGPRLWALPDAQLGWWILREEDTGRPDGLTEGIPTIFIPALSTDEKHSVADCCRQFVSSRLRDHWHEDLFELIKRLMVGGTFLVGGLIALRFIEFFDIPIILGAMSYTTYAAIRYGMRLARSLEAAHRPYSNFMGEPFVVSALSERLSAALEFRRAQPNEKRGEAPDAELLDANAYRKLIREGVVTREELCGLGRAVQARLDMSAGTTKKLSDVSHTEGLDEESASLYRDLALAAAEIEFDSEFK